MRRAVASGISTLCLGLLAGCAVTTTQTQSSRIKLDRERALATRSAVIVDSANPDIAVERVDAVRSRRGAAIAVRLRNLTDRPVGDLPVSVGVNLGGSRRLLNSRPGLGYFDTHAPALGAGQSQVWVLPMRGGLPAGRPFAVVGRATTPAAPTVAELPIVKARASGSRGAIAAEIHNSSDVPQSSVQVYAWSTAEGRIVAAGRGSVGSLAPGDSAALRIRLIGSPRGGSSVSAPATVYE